MDGTGETDACRPIQTAGNAMAEAKSQTHGHCEEQRRCLVVTTSVLHRRFSFPLVNHNNCFRDCLLRVFPLDSIRPAARRDMQAGRHAIIETGVLLSLRLFVHAPCHVEHHVTAEDVAVGFDLLLGIHRVAVGGHSVEEVEGFELEVEATVEDAA